MDRDFTDNERKLAGALSAALAVAGPEWMIGAAMQIAELTMDCDMMQREIDGLKALLADADARVKDTEEQLNSTERLLVKRNDEFNRLVAAIDAEREDYARILVKREIIETKEATD